MTAFNSAGVPADLRPHAQFVLWRLVPDWTGKAKKMPFQADGTPAEAGAPSTWTDHGTALAAYERGGFDGVGFEFHGDPFTFIDLDWKAEPGATEAVPAWAQAVLDRFPGAAAERSVSKMGLHLFVRGGVRFPDGTLGGRHGGIEVYAGAHFCALTGDALPGREAIGAADESAALEAFAREQMPRKFAAPPAVVTEPRHGGLSDADTVVLARQRFGAAFAALYDADDIRPGKSASEPIFTLLRMLATVCGNDPERIKRIVLAGARQRDSSKWPRLLDHDVRAAIASVKPGTDDGATPEAEPLRVWSLRESLEHPPAPPRAVVPMLAWERRITLVAALDGLGKSTLFRAAAAAVSRGGEFLGAPAGPGAVLWVRAEEPEDHFAFEARRFGADVDAFRHIGRRETHIADLDEAVAAVRPALVVVDTLHSWAGVEEASQGGGWRAALDALKRARDAGAAVLLSAEAVKSTGDYADSRAIAHAIDVRMVLRRPDLESPTRVLEVPKSRVAGVPPRFAVALDGTTYRRTSADAATGDDIVRALADGPLTKAALQLRLGRSESTVERLIAQAGTAVAQVEGTGRRNRPVEYRAVFPAF